MDTTIATTGPVTPELVMELPRPGEVALSADAKRIAFVVAASFREKGKPVETRLWVGDVDGELRQGDVLQVDLGAEWELQRSEWQRRDFVGKDLGEDRAEHDEHHQCDEAKTTK